MQKALNLIVRKGSNVVKKVGPDSVVRIYDKTANELVALNVDGSLRTLFKPDPSIHHLSTNIDYWNSLPGTEILN